MTCSRRSVNLFVCVFTAELRNALPEMVVEILQEKLDRKIIDDISSFPEMNVESDVALTSSHSAENMMSARCNDGLSTFPKNWEPMDASEVSRLLIKSDIFLHASLDTSEVSRLLITV